MPPDSPHPLVVDHPEVRAACLADASAQQPMIIQGGMGVGVSAWPLARAVSLTGQLGVVSGTALDTVLVRRLQDGDADGAMRRAMRAFPIQEVAERIQERYFLEGGRKPGVRYKAKPVPNLHPSKFATELIVVANFAEVFLAKEGHPGLVGLNLLEKIQLPTLPSLFGAMLARVDYVLMGAGIPRAIPEALDHLAALERTRLKVDVRGALSGEEHSIEFDPLLYVAVGSKITRPMFLAIVSSTALATTLAKKCTGKVNGFVVEGCTAGGHNAPPRGATVLDDVGQPVYGPRDVPDLQQFCDLGLPFWLAGSYGSPEKLREASMSGAHGVQVGTLFAFCEESSIDPTIKSRILSSARHGAAQIFTDPLASPAGFPFKVVSLEGSVSDPLVYEPRQRICDLGYLRELYRQPDGKVGYRCPGEPLKEYLRKGGQEKDTLGRKCLCNGLAATIGLAQRQKSGQLEPPLVTAGDEINSIAKLIKMGRDSYSAAEVVDYLLGADALNGPETNRPVDVASAGANLGECK